MCCFITITDERWGTWYLYLYLQAQYLYLYLYLEDVMYLNPLSFMQVYAKPAIDQHRTDEKIP